MFGGIIGYLEGGLFESYNIGEVSGNSYVGGIFGQGHHGNWMHIQKCYSNGNITGNTYVGDLIGYGNVGLSKLFYFPKKYGAVNGQDIDNIATEITEEQLKNSTFWKSNSFSETYWNLNDGKAPKLKWEDEVFNIT